jgi:hypothetical protein
LRGFSGKLLQGAIIMSDAYTDDEPAKRGRDAGLWRSFDQTFAEARASFTDTPPDDLGQWQRFEQNPHISRKVLLR